MRATPDGELLRPGIVPRVVGDAVKTAVYWQFLRETAVAPSVPPSLGRGFQ